MSTLNLLPPRLLIVLATPLVLSGPVQADDATPAQSRSSLSVVQFEDSIQLVQVVGPTERPIASERIDKNKQTYVMLRAVPDAMHVMGDLIRTVPIRGVILHGCGLDDAGLKTLAERHPGLKTLILRSPKSLPREEVADLTASELSQLFTLQISPSALETVRTFGNLYTLGIIGYRLPPTRLQVLSAMPDLTSLFLAESDVSDSDLQAVAGVHKLQNLSLSGTSVTGKGIAHIRNCHQLTLLDLDKSQVGDEVLGVFADHKWQQLRFVFAYKSRITGDGVNSLRQLAPFTECFDLNRRVEAVSPLVVESPQTLRQYRASAFVLMYYCGAELDIRRGRVEWLKLPERPNVPTDTMLQQVAWLTDLRTLGLAGRKVSADGIHHLVEMPNLEELDLARSTLDDKGLIEVSGVKTLRILSLAGTRVTDLGVRHLRRIKSLEELSLKNTAVTDASLEVIANLPNLRKLDLENCPITDKGVECLLQMNSLETVDVQGTNTSLEAQIKIYEHLRAIRQRHSRELRDSDDFQPRSGVRPPPLPPLRGSTEHCRPVRRLTPAATCGRRYRGSTTQGGCRVGEPTAGSRVALRFDPPAGRASPSRSLRLLKQSFGLSGMTVCLAAGGVLRVSRTG